MPTKQNLSLSLAVAYPELVSQWNFKKNGKLTPFDVAPKSNRKVWWICSKNHEWEARISHRVIEKSGCPYCSNRKVLTGFNDLAHKYPHVLSLWDYQKNSSIDPTLILPSSVRKIWCRCGNGHEFQIIIRNLVNGKGCPKCNAIQNASNRVAQYASSFLSRLEQSNSYFKDIELLGQYTGIWNEIPCKCKRCGFIWKPKASILLEGCGCPRCHKKSYMTFEDFVKLFSAQNEHYNNISLLGEYSNLNTPLKCSCKLCGYEWEATPKALLKGACCPRCEYRARSGNLQLSHESFVERMSLINPNIEFMTRYLRNREKVSCRCNKCGYEWSALPSNLLKGKGCPKCANRVRLTHAEFLDRIKSNPHLQDIDFLGEFELFSKPIPCHCKVCGHNWDALPSVLMRGGGCRKCGNIRKGEKKILSHNAFVMTLKEHNKRSDLIELLGKYKGGHERIECRCKVCGHVWTPLADNLLKGKGCPHCAHVQTSFAEQFLYWGLACKLGVDEVLSRDRKSIGNELDILIPKWNFAIEYGSWFWHKNRLQRDIIKLQACKTRNIELLIIFDGFAEQGGVPNEPPVAGCKLFSQDLGSEAGHVGLKSIVCEILQTHGAEASFSDCEWNDIERRAITESQLMTDNDFTDLLQINPRTASIELLSQFAGTESRVLCRCRICGEEWSPLAKNLLRGHACPKCARVRESKARRVKVEDFLLRLQNSNPKWNTMEIIGPFNGMNKRVLCRCRVCGNRWEAFPSNLITGHACPKCGRRHR